MEFKKMKEIFQANFADLASNADALFEVDLDKDKLWDTYLASFPPGTNEIYRKQREHDCSACHRFIKAMGNVVFIKNNEIYTIWDFITGDPTWDTVLQEMDKFVRLHEVTDFFITKDKKIGTDKDHESIDGQIVTWDHFFLVLPDKFVARGSRSVGDLRGEKRAIRDVFKRSLDEITEESVVTVLELISQNSLYKGEEWKSILEEFLRYKRTYLNLQSDFEDDNYAWEQSSRVGPVIGKIRNHSIGTLLVDISNNVDLDKAVSSYEKIVAPTNYKRPQAIFTQKMLDDAKKKIEELGYMNSLGRRFATLDDITVNNILFSNKDAAKRIAGSVFDEMASSMPVSPKKFDKVEEISADDFVKNVLPLAAELEVLFESKHMGSLVSLIAPQNKEAPSMFKWNNAFGWAYSGNITDSNLKENVKNAGGNVDGDLRFSIQWNDIEFDHCDLDAHCIEPSGEEIAFNTSACAPGRSRTGGQLDVDIIRPIKDVPAVENITWPTRTAMRDGVYKFFVHNYSGGNNTGFRAEIEFDGQIYAFDFNQPTRSGMRTQVAEVTLKDGVFSIKELLPSNLSSREVWGIKTNQFMPVSVVMYSPNYWDEQDGIGHRHYFFMLKDCVNPENPNGFYNEFLKNELIEHKRVFEALGGKMAVKFVEDQLSGVGFSSTKRNELIVKVKGQSERILKIKF
jgi:hypothetical protein